MKKIWFAIVGCTLLTSCISTKSTIKNIDDTAQRPVVRDNYFLLTEYSDNAKYGYDEDYPVNIGFIPEAQEKTNVAFFFNGLEGPDGQKLVFEKKGTCCPFPTKHNRVGAGMLNIYSVSWEGLKTPLLLYFNTFEKGKIMCPKGLSIKKSPSRTQ
ncbi:MULTISPECIES: 2-dehydro-3-deoxyphosphooctonate aldolase [Flavobacterium]|uniref:2-dehydro-3-deoxyphosphooctonate aldolase n=1 Tax=Flavobacterium TaxID=237 RepID=UPI00086A2E90|nr:MULTISPECIES: 2-dehydro-3-deoxyphosphooctonate aldolase [Flavobacterium]MBN9284200.1 2-dehydro-3-deoxyphosphooctonate aldolase [Flavobacterium sp.]ODS83368.1 MAG: 2-dehydro-3-deoxyphosphooctonate aldolase [Chryseobacterium sp. SCN 40-13]OJV70716.1 MAG: 2-dehydro-3-deoxyphosphooctonate aldolase [Flavobacterium sp. 40-81]